MTETPYQKSMRALDELHAMDPRSTEADGKTIPMELWHARRMTYWLEQLETAPPQLLQLAVRAQHLQRWELLRSQYPDGRKGYLHWRRDQGKRAGETVARIMLQAGYPQSEAERVARMVRKEGRQRDPEVQTVEDCACLVFLENYLSGFSRQVERDHVLRIIQKTWQKMSPLARTQALKLSMPPRSREMVEEALSA